jgi:hypothetical protein
VIDRFGFAAAAFGSRHRSVLRCRYCMPEAEYA